MIGPLPEASSRPAFRPLVANAPSCGSQRLGLTGDGGERNGAAVSTETSSDALSHTTQLRQSFVTH